MQAKNSSNEMNQCFFKRKYLQKIDVFDFFLSFLDGTFQNFWPYMGPLDVKGKN